MKKIILFLFIPLFLNTFTNSQTWRKAYDTPIPAIKGGCTTDANTAWLGGANQSIFKSTDRGITWIDKFHINSLSNFVFDISFINSTTGFAGCNSGKILKTTDGGDTWQSLFVPNITYAVTKIHFFDANLGFTLCTNGTSSIIYKSTDGGNSWTTTATISAAMEAMDFYSPTVGIATGADGNIWYTTNGTTWAKGSVAFDPSLTYSRLDQWGVKFTSATTAVSCGWGSTALGYEPTIFLKTTDGGVTWNQMVQTAGNKTYVNFQSIYFKDQLNGIAVGGSATPGTVICRTTDGGTNWIPLPTVSGFTPAIVLGFYDTLIVSGGNGNIILSSDFGNSWAVENNHPSSTMSSINIVNNNIYACGGDGIFFKSTDSGASFDMSYMVSGNKCLWSKGIYFLNDSLGFAASQKGQALKTTNAGLTWTQVIRDSVSNSINNAGVYFIDENIGFVVGNYNSNVDIIYKTTNGGATWSNLVNKAYQTLNCVSFADANHGAAGGNHSTILYTTDQGVFWNVSTVNTTDQLAINGINFYDGLNGISVGTGIILKTTNGGATWNRIAVPGYAATANLTSVCHFGSTLYSAGGKYCLKSTDTGNTWANIMDTIFAAQNNITSMNSLIADSNGNIWIATVTGLITNASITLPVELTSFTYKSANNSVRLDWITQTEVNNNHFEIERKNQNASWEKAGEVMGSGNSNSPKRYSFTDKKYLTNGRYFYRLKQVDNDGRFKYSNEIEVNVSYIPNVYSLENNFPNPFNPSTRIRYSLPFDSNVKLAVYNSLGQLVSELSNEIKQAGTYEIYFSSSSLASGVYFYSIQANSLDGKKNFTSTKKMMYLK